jgi:hypothetical protein
MTRSKTKDPIAPIGRADRATCPHVAALLNELPDELPGELAATAHASW